MHSLVITRTITSTEWKSHRGSTSRAKTSRLSYITSTGMAKSLKKRGNNTKGVKRVSADRATVGVRNFEIINRLGSGS
jgi:hypothetical protein